MGNCQNKTDYNTGPKIRDLIKSKKISKAKFARELGYDRKTLDNWFDHGIPLADYEAKDLEDTYKRFKTNTTKKG